MKAPNILSISVADLEMAADTGVASQSMVMSIASDLLYIYRQAQQIAAIPEMPISDAHVQMIIDGYDKGHTMIIPAKHDLVLAKEVQQLRPIKSAAEKLVRCKGRYHSEQNYRALAELFGVTTPDLPPMLQEKVSSKDAIAKFREYNIGFPVERLKADYVISWMLANYPFVAPEPVPVMVSQCEVCGTACSDHNHPQRAVPAAKPELTVWYGSMPESNGKSNWTAILHRKGEGIQDGMTIDRSEYPDRVLYAANRVRYLIGEQEDRPHILDYNADKHSGYVWPRTKESAAVETLESKGYTWHGGELWKPPLGKAPAYITGETQNSDLLQRAEMLAEQSREFANSLKENGFAVTVHEPTEQDIADRVMRIDVTVPRPALKITVPRPYLTDCAAARDGECNDPRCPQLRDNEPYASGRHCPLDHGEDEE